MLFSPPYLFLPRQIPQRPLIQLFVMWLHLNIDCPFITFSNVPNKWHSICKRAAALVNGHNKCHFTKEVSDEQLWTSKTYLWGTVIKWIAKFRGKMALSLYESNTHQRFVTSLIKTRWRCLCDICKLHSVLGLCLFPPPNWIVLWLLQINQLSWIFNRIGF